MKLYAITMEPAVNGWHSSRPAAFRDRICYGPSVGGGEITHSHPPTPCFPRTTPECKLAVNA